MRHDYVHAFGGVIGDSQENNESFLSKQKVLVNSPNFKLCIPNEVPNSLYQINDTSFLWNGGSKTIENLNKFDYRTEDSKFVYLEFNKDNFNIISDHYSKIPFLYIYKNGTLYFSTSLRYLLTLSNSKSFEVDYDGLLLFYNYGINSFETGIIKDLKVLPGGTKMSFKNNTLSVTKYYDITKLESNWKNSNTDAENIKLIDDVLLKSTTKTVENYNKIGIALSGGLDSGYLAQKISQTRKPFNAYTLGYKGDYNEFERIDYLSNALNFKANKIVIDDKEMVDNFIELSGFASFPLEFNNTILNFIYKAASNDGVEVMFDGDGADRLFLGMNKYLQLKKFLSYYSKSKKAGIHKMLEGSLGALNHTKTNKLLFYLRKFNLDIPFYGERRLSDSIAFDEKFEKKLNDLILPEELKNIDKNVDPWLYFSLFSVYYTPTFFFHSPYEIQLKHSIVSNPEFWSDDMVKLALSIPTESKLYKKTTKKILRDAAKTNIDDGYWNLKKIGLQNSFKYVKSKAYGKDFVESYVELIKKSDEFLYLVENTPDSNVNPERLLAYHIWKEKLV